jgi:superfamily I DNA and/or RNA helicase
LGPTVQSPKSKNILEKTLFERYYYEKKSFEILLIQYRMNEDIMNWSSSEFYENKLIAHDDNKYHLLNDLLNVDGIFLILLLQMLMRLLILWCL